MHGYGVMMCTCIDWLYASERSVSDCESSGIMQIKVLSEFINFTYSIFLYQVQISNYWLWFWARDAMNLEVLQGLVHKPNAQERQEYE